MYKTICEYVSRLTMSDKYLLGVSIAILANPTIAMLAAIVVVLYFFTTLVHQVAKDMGLKEQ